MRKAVFIDRDGVINDDRENYYIFRPQDFKINTGVLDALKKIQEKGYLLIVISNQGGIARGQYTKEEVDHLHLHFQNELLKHGAEITEFFYCPHHHTVENCLCRKPRPLMLQKALAKYNIDANNSYFIGDKKSDVEAGKLAGVKPILVKPNTDLEAVIDLIS